MASRSLRSRTVEVQQEDRNSPAGESASEVSRAAVSSLGSLGETTLSSPQEVELVSETVSRTEDLPVEPEHPS
jgi:hypothetical protein